MKPIAFLFIIELLFITACSGNRKQCLEDGEYFFAGTRHASSNPDIVIKADHYVFYRNGQEKESGKIENLGSCRFRLTTEKWIRDTLISDNKAIGDVEKWKITRINEDTLVLDYDAPSLGMTGTGIKLVRIKKAEK